MPQGNELHVLRRDQDKCTCGGVLSVSAVSARKLTDSGGAEASWDGFTFKCGKCSKLWYDPRLKAYAARRSDPTW